MTTIDLIRVTGIPRSTLSRKINALLASGTIIKSKERYTIENCSSGVK